MSEVSPLRNFLIRRFFRIAPLFWCAILAYSLLNGFSPSYWAPNGIKWWFLLLTALFMHGWSPETSNSVVDGGWVIAVEVSFYLVAPILFRWAKDVKTSLGFLIFSLIVGWGLSRAALAAWSPHYPAAQQYLVTSYVFLFWFFAQLPVFGVGIIVYHLFKRWRDTRDRTLSAILLLSALLLFVAFLGASSFQNILPQTFLYAVAFGIFALALHFWPTRILVNPVTQWIGKLSYSIFLTHFAVLALLGRVFPNGFILSGDLGFVVAFVLTTLLSAGVSVLAYNLVERPGLRLGRLLIARLERRSASRP